MSAAVAILTIPSIHASTERAAGQWQVQPSTGARVRPSEHTILYRGRPCQSFECRKTIQHITMHPAATGRAAVASPPAAATSSSSSSSKDGHAKKGWTVGSVCNTTTVACLLVAAYVCWCSLGIHRVVRRAPNLDGDDWPDAQCPPTPCLPPFSINMYTHFDTRGQMYPLQYVPPLEPGAPTLDPLWPEGRRFDLLCYIR